MCQKVHVIPKREVTAEICLPESSVNCRMIEKRSFWEGVVTGDNFWRGSRQRYHIPGVYNDRIFQEAEPARQERVFFLRKISAGS